MTRAFLKFGSKPTSYAPKISARRLGVLPFVTASYKSDGDDDDDEEEAAKTRLLKQIRKEFSKALEDKDLTTEEDVQNIVKEQMKAFEGLDVATLKALTDKENGVLKMLQTQGAAIAELKEEAKKAGQDATLSRRSQIKKWQEENKENLDKLKAGIQVELKPLTLKAPATMMMSTHVGTPSSTVALYLAQGAQIVEEVRAQPSFWDMIPKGRTGLPALPFVNKVNPEGNAAFIAEGALKPLIDFELAADITTPKKVADRAKASTEILYDIDSMESMIEDELRYKVMIAANTAVLTGTLSSTSPAGITTVASAYSLTTIKTPNPNNYDAIRAALAQVVSLNFNRNLVAVINPIDGANMDLAKATTSGVYLLPPFTTADGRRVGPVRIVEDNNIPVGFLLLADLAAYKIIMYQDFFIAWGWENDDFSKNLVTAIGEMRFYQYINSSDTGAIIYDSFADIKAALTPA